MSPPPRHFPAFLTLFRPLTRFYRILLWLIKVLRKALPKQTPSSCKNSPSPPNMMDYPILPSRLPEQREMLPTQLDNMDNYSICTTAGSNNGSRANQQDALDRSLCGGTAAPIAILNDKDAVSAPQIRVEPPIPEPSASVVTFQSQRSNEPCSNGHGPVLRQPSYIHSISDTNISCASPYQGKSSGKISIVPILPVYLTRYTIRLPRLQDDHTLSSTPISPMASLESCSLDKWRKYIHPHGLPYWHRIIEGSSIDVVTDSNILTESIRNLADQALSQLAPYTAQHSSKSGIQLVLEILETYNSCGYYLVDSATHSIFWEHSPDLAKGNPEWASLRPLDPATMNLSDTKQYLEYNYWMHFEYYPHVQKSDESIIVEAAKLVTELILDSATDKDTTCPFQHRDLMALHAVFTSGRVSMWSIGRFMSFINYHRSANYYGDYGARVTRTQSVCTSHRGRSLLIKLVSPLMLYTPDVHLRLFESIWVDKTVSIHPWAEFVRKMNKQWQGFVTCASVLLATNMGFLAIQSVDNDKDDYSRTSAQLFSYMSTFASVDSIIMGLLLTRHLRSRDQANAKSAADYLRKQYHSRFGHEPLAIMFALPHVFMNLAIILFLITFTLTCMVHTTSSTRLVITAFEVACLIPVGWAVWTHWGADYPIPQAVGLDSDNSPGRLKWIRAALSKILYASRRQCDSSHNAC